MLSAPWFASARDERELELRRRVAMSPYATMLDVLAWLDDTAGGVDQYLLAAGVSDAQLRLLRARLVD